MADTEKQKLEQEIDFLFDALCNVVNLAHAEGSVLAVKRGKEYLDVFCSDLSKNKG